MIQFLLVSRLMRELVNVLIMVCPNPQRHAKGRLSSINSARMPPKNSGKFVINKKFNEGQGIICSGPHKIQFYVFTGSGSVNTGKYKADNWGEEDESQQDIR